MKFKVGDKVRFLDEQGGGIVSRIISSKMVMVTVEDGFELPTLVNNLLSADLSFSLHPAPEPEVQEEVQEATEHDHEADRMSRVDSTYLTRKTAAGIYLLFSPHEQRWLISGILDVFLINHTSHDILYNLFLENADGKPEPRDYGSLYANSKLHLETVKRDDLPFWSKGIIQVLFHGLHENIPLKPLEHAFSISGSKFYKEESYRESPFLEGKSIQYCCGEIKNPTPSLPVGGEPGEGPKV